MPGAAVPYAVYRGAALPGYLGRSEKNRGASDGGGPTTVVKPIFMADLKVDISIQPLLFMEDIIYGRFRGDLWDLNRT